MDGIDDVRASVSSDSSDSSIEDWYAQLTGDTLSDTRRNREVVQWPGQARADAEIVALMAPLDFYDVYAEPMNSGTERYVILLFDLARLGDWMAHVLLSQRIPEAKEHVDAFDLTLLMIPSMDDYQNYVYGSLFLRMKKGSQAIEMYRRSFYYKATFALAMGNHLTPSERERELKDYADCPIAAIEPYLSFVICNHDRLADYGESDPRAACLYARSGHNPARAKELLRKWAIQGIEKCAWYLIHTVGIDDCDIPTCIAAGVQCVRVLGDPSFLAKITPDAMHDVLTRDTWLDAKIDSVYHCHNQCRLNE